MKKLFLLVLVGLGFTSIHSASAAVGQSVGKTTCYVFKQGKLTTKAQCDMYTAGGANSVYPMYGFENYTVRVPKVGILDVINSTSCESENKCESEYTLNKKQAKSQYRASAVGYKLIPNKQAEKLLSNNPSKTNLLSCDSTKDNRLEICTPVNDTENFEMVIEPPKWAE